MRADLHNLVVWFKEWQILFNVEKCKVMHLGYNNPKVNMQADRVDGLNWACTSHVLN